MVSNYIPNRRTKEILQIHSNARVFNEKKNEFAENFQSKIWYVIVIDESLDKNNESK